MTALGGAASSPRRRFAVLFVAFASFALGAPKAQAAVLTVDDNRVECAGAGFESIKAAIDNAGAGDVVNVCPGHYTEPVVVPAEKSGLVLQGPGAEADCFEPEPAPADPAREAIVEAGAGFTSFKLDADRVVLKGFVVQGASIGIETSDSHSGYQIHHNLIQRNVDPSNSVPSTSYRGFGLDFGSNGASQSRVDHNCFRHNGLGGVLSELDDDYIADPRLVPNRTNGRDLHNAVIDHNDSFQDPEGLVLVGPGSRSNVTIEHNTVRGRIGVGISNSTGSTIAHNDISGPCISSLAIDACARPRPLSVPIGIGGANAGLEVAYNQARSGVQGIVFVLSGLYIDRFPSDCVVTATIQTCIPNVGLAVHDNEVADNRLDGIVAAPFAVHDSSFDTNEANANGVDTREGAARLVVAGITVRPGNTGNSFKANVANGNAGFGIYACAPTGAFVCNRGDANVFLANTMRGNGSYDARDDNSGPTNTWIRNDCGTSLTPNYMPSDPICSG